jgi:hypothetical protein
MEGNLVSLYPSSKWFEIVYSKKTCKNEEEQEGDDEWKKGEKRWKTRRRNNGRPVKHEAEPGNHDQVEE